MALQLSTFNSKHCALSIMNYQFWILNYELWIEQSYSYSCYSYFSKGSLWIMKANRQLWIMNFEFWIELRYSYSCYSYFSKGSLWIMKTNRQLWILNYELWIQNIVNCQLWILNYELWIQFFQLSIFNFQLKQLSIALNYKQHEHSIINPVFVSH